MTKSSPLHTFIIKERKLQLVVIAILILLLPILLFLLQQALSIRSKAAPDASLKLVPRNVAQTPEGTWKFSLNQQTSIDVVIQSGSNEVEIVQVGIFYDPAVVSLKNQTGKSSENITCSQLTPVKNKVAAYVAGLTVDTNGNETGTETGYASIVCSALEGVQADVPYTPIPANFVGPIATFLFTPLATAESQTLSIHFTPESPRSDSSILAYQGHCCSDVDVLQSVENLAFDVAPAHTTAQLALSPSFGTIALDQTFDVQVNLSTGPYQVDSVDAIIEYDKTVLEAVKVNEGVIFPNYAKVPGASGISTAGPTGKIEVSAQIHPTSSQGVQGDNLLFATITFRAIREASASDITFKVDAAGGRNDTNIVLFHEGTDVLSQVINGQYHIVSETGTSPTPTPTTVPRPASLRLEPVSGNHVVGKAFDTNIVLSTGGKSVDAAETILVYDPRYLQYVSTTPAQTFYSYGNTIVNTQAGPNQASLYILGIIQGGADGVSGENLPVATVRFEPTAPVDQSSVTIFFRGPGDLNDSNLPLHLIGTDNLAFDTLGSVQNASYRIVGQGQGLIKRILLKIALQGRNAGFAKNIRIKFLGTTFEGNPINVTTTANGEAELSTILQNSLNQGWYALLLKPHGYLQRKITMTLDQEDNTIDLTGSPFKSGDLDDSGAVNSLDWVRLLAAFNTSTDDADIDASGKVTVLDYTYILLNWFAQDEQ